MDELLTDIIDFNKNVVRNVVNIEDTINPFSDISNNNSSYVDVAENAIALTKKRISTSKQLSDFYYTTAIAYPFTHEPFMKSRYSDGGYPIWYGSMDLLTSIHETVYHTFEDVFAIENIDDFEVIEKSRAVYDVHCQAVLIDVSKKVKQHPQLVSNNYELCHTLGTRLASEGYPGLMTLSARCSGNNINIFKKSALSNPMLNCLITYKVDCKRGTVDVINEQGDIIHTKAR